MSPQEWAEPGENRRVLIVEDEFLSAIAVEEALVLAGFRVIGIAGETATALTLAEAERPDLAIVDVKLRSGCDGVATALLLRQRFDVPSIFVSGNLDPETRRRTAPAGPAGFVDKPYTESQLVEAVRRVPARPGARRPMLAA